MKSIRKRAPLWFACVLCIIISAALAVTGLPSAFAEESVMEGGVLTYSTDDEGNATILSCLTSADDAQVEAAFEEICSPSGIRVRDIVAIGNDAFSFCTDLTNISIPTRVTSIGNYAFSYCSGLESVIIPDGVTSIDRYVFYGCTSLTSIDIPDGVTSIGESAFSYCTALTSVIISAGIISIGDFTFGGCAGLTSIDIPDGVTSIGEGAFYGCTGLTNVFIPDGVKTIGDRAFNGCAGLESVNISANVISIGDIAFANCNTLYEIAVDPTNAYFTSDTYGVLFDKEQTSLIQYPVGNNRSDYTVPSGVTSIADYAFANCTALANVNILDSVASIGIYAFYGCVGLENISIPGNVASIGEGVFHGCIGLKNIAISDNVTAISNYAFSGCTNLTNITIPDGVPSIGRHAFSGCTGLTSIIIPDSVTSIGINTFQGCSSLTGNITIPDGVTSIGGNTFYGCAGLTSIAIPDSVTSIGGQAFYGCSGLTDINIPDSVTSIGDSAFYGCNGLMNIFIPSGMTSIGYNAFYYTHIEKINIPASVTTASAINLNGPFSGMNDLNEIVFKHGMESFPTDILLGSLSNNPDIYVPMSIASGADTAGYTASYDPVIHGIKGTYIIEWAKENGIKYNAIDGEIRKTDIEHAWLNVPYQYIIETGTYENVGLNFNLVGGVLPDGLELLPDGRFHGAPLETGTFTFVVEVRYPVFDYLLDIQSIVLTVEEPVGYPGDIELFESNDYPITDFVGESTATVDGVPVGYVLTAVRDDVNEWIFRVADNDINEDGLIDADDSNFPYFTDFWLDGEKLTSASAISGGDYGASEGSTVVTVYAKTFQNLDNGNHTIAAEFMIPTRENDPPVQKVAAQKFTLELSDPEPVPEEKPDPEPDPDLNNDPDPDLNTDPDPEPGPNTDPESEPDPNTDPEPNPEPKPEQNEPDPEPGQNTLLPGGSSGGGYTAAATAQSGTEPNSPVALQTSTDTSAADETRVAPVVAPEAAITEAEDTGATGGDTNPAGTVGASTVDGLPRDENGLFYFVLDGSGAPLEARIDIPLADFADMYFDGELWALGEDYETREGSTVIIIAAEKLAGLAYGLHEIDARFTGDRTVSFAFDLRGPAPASGAEAGPIAPAEETANAVLALAAGSGIPTAPFVIAALIVAMLIAAAFILRARHMRRAG